MIRKILFGAFCVSFMVSTAHARSERLWMERAAAEPPMAQVPNFKTLAAALRPVVVSIQVEHTTRQRMQGHPGGDPFEMLRRFYGGEPPPEQRNRGVGSGFVIRQDGLILTNNHVVEHADSIEVTFTDDKNNEHSYPAEVLGTAPNYDVALLKIKSPGKWPTSYLGDSDGMEIGDWVMAIGNPFGLSHSVSVGIISAKQRRSIAPSGRAGYYDFIQTDASINPGNSGGPLVNMRGEVIGINAAVNAQGSGIGFAIPINIVKQVLPELKNKGHFTRGWLGLRLQSLTRDMAKSLGLSEPQGALVAEVVPNGPAAKAGLREGDVITAFDNKLVRDSDDLRLIASLATVGRGVPVKLWRAGNSQQVVVNIEGFPDDTSVASGPSALPRATATQTFGMAVGNMTPELKQMYGLQLNSGVVVRDLDPSGLAARSGLMIGDVLLSINGVSLTSPEVLASTAKQISSGSLVRFHVARRDGRLFVVLRKP